MIILFDDGGDKLAEFHKNGYSVGRFGVNRIWATDLTGMEGTKEDIYNSIEEAIFSLGSKGMKYSPVFNEEGIEVAIYSSNDPDIILVQRYKLEEKSVIKIGSAKSMKLNKFKEDWNKYKNTGIKIDLTNDWVDDSQN